MYRHILVPTDGSNLSIETVAEAVRFASAIGAKVTFFTAQPDYGKTDSGALDRVIAPNAYVEKAAGDARAYLAKAATVAQGAGVPYESIVRVSDRPYESILEVAVERGCDLIFMASHGRTGLRGLVLGSQTQKVLLHAKLPVLISTPERNRGDSRSREAVMTIRNEHLSIGAVVNGMQYLVRQYQTAQGIPDFKLLHAMLYYINTFPEKLHHPKEERYLFAKLKQRTHAVNDVLSQLESEHARELELIAELRASIVAYEAGDENGLAKFASSVEAFAEFVWAHIGLEENVIIPAAEKHLSNRDWYEIARAFSENGDPCFAADSEASYKNLFSQIMNLAAQSNKA
jgi:nucleotide-binding universal stress UspA family protein/hemerythrin-like domain-containing protein